MAIHRAIGDDAIVGVKMIHQLAARPHASRSAGQRAQQPELHRRQVQPLTMQRRAASILVDMQAFGCHHCAVAISATDRADPRDDLAWAEGLEDVIDRQSTRLNSRTYCAYRMPTTD